MKDFKFFKGGLPFSWAHYGEHEETKRMSGIEWYKFLDFVKKRGKETYIITVEIEETSDEYGLDIFEGEPNKFFDVIEDDTIVDVYFA